MVLRLRQLGASFDGTTFDWGQVKTLRLVYRCQRDSKLTAGKVLSHAKSLVASFREGYGVRVCCFKIGVTSNPLIRFSKYLQLNYSSMWLLAVSNSADWVHMLEASLISEYAKHVGCHNKDGTGGEGALNRSDPPPPPYYVYIVGTRADQAKRIG